VISKPLGLISQVRNAQSLIADEVLLSQYFDRCDQANSSCYPLISVLTLEWALMIFFHGQAAGQLPFNFTALRRRLTRNTGQQGPGKEQISAKLKFFSRMLITSNFTSDTWQVIDSVIR
jgi:hypothetical protein